MMYLYVKTHNVTGLKYLGKTMRKDYHSYPGSGKRWLNHLNKHGFDYSTSVLLCTEDKNELKETGKFFSKLWNVVHSDEWGNMRPEEGDGGDTSIYVDHIKRGKSISETKNSKEWKETVGVSSNIKISTSESVTKQSLEWKNTVGKRVSEEAKRRQNDPIWKENQGSLIAEKAKARWANDDYKKSISSKISEKQNDPEWKAKHYKECKCCDRLISPGNYKKHTEKCWTL